jgi:hypothetical protein
MGKRRLAEYHRFGSFRSLGALVTKANSYMITELDASAEPLHTFDWIDSLQEGSPMQEMGHMVWPETAVMLARAHHVGAYHGDPQPKNVITRPDGTFALIDWEAASFLRRPDWATMDFVESETTRHKIERDLIVLFGGLTRSVQDEGVGMLTGLTPEAQYSYFKELVLRPYMKARLDLAEDYDQIDVMAMIDTLGAVEEKLERYIKDGELQKTLSRVRQRIASS